MVLDVKTVYTSRGRQEKKSLHKSSLPQKSSSKGLHTMTLEMPPDIEAFIPLMEPLQPVHSKVITHLLFKQSVADMRNQSQNNYLRDFMSRQNIYLQHLILQEAPPPG
jgi:hypothetical protein